MAKNLEIVIAGAARTPIGSFCGALENVAASELGAVAIRAALERAATKAEEVDEVIMGHVLTAGLGQNTARQAAKSAGVPVESTAYAINQVCGSGLRSVALA
ncbi:MAG: acetyl-CoA C-acetyltransferase, partial [Rhodospirillaceae bacterium]|nr:acetyl-CoA C-acetyltransferase [Rhodospirillaceae bacterium]